MTRRACEGASIRDAGVFSGAAFVMAFRDETQQAFLEGHVRALEWHGGVFDLVRYDNLRPRSCGCSRAAGVESDRFVGFVRTTGSSRRSACQAFREPKRRAGLHTAPPGVDDVDSRFLSRRPWCLTSRGSSAAGGS